MATLVTWADLLAEIDDLVVEDDMIGLANKAVKRLYAKAPTAGRVIEIRLKTQLHPDAVVEDAFIAPLEDMEDVYKLPDTFDNILKFKFNGLPRDVIPVQSEFSGSGYDYKAFVDLGDLDGSGRYYRRPFDVVQLGTTTGDFDECVTALARKSYIPVVETTDTFSFSNVDALKLAVLASTYEDLNDLERANEFWEQAKQELEIESARFRGPHKMTINMHDPAMQDVVESIN
jgi:hypothetical protein